jgi:UPF0042 nucleotide-binding protein
MIQKVISFGYKHGTPPVADNTWDVRDLLPNPWTHRVLRGMTGKDLGVKKFVTESPSYAPLIKAILEAGGSTIAIGCTGGRHRSVVVAEEIALRARCTIEHRDMRKE